MSAYLGLSSFETLRFYKTIRGEIPPKNYPRSGIDRPLGLQMVEAPRISRQSAYEGDTAVSPRHRPTVPSRDIPGTLFC